MMVRTRLLVVACSLLLLTGCQVEQEQVSVCENNKIVHEKNGHLSKIAFLYKNTIGCVLRRLTRTHFAAKLYAWYQDSSWSKKKIAPFIKKHSINIDDFIVPAGGFQSFNDFFIRKLKSGARAIDTNPRVFIAPADSKLFVVPELEQGTRFFVKSKPFCTKTFLQDESLAQEYAGGTLLLFRLAPYDYHRYHFPCQGVPSKAKMINGTLESVHPLAYRAGLLPLQENERQCILFETKMFGKVAMVAVGAMFVGRITHTYNPLREHTKGDEVGYFSFGGSSFVVLIKKGVLKIDDKFIECSKKNIETVVKMGERIGVRL